MELTTHHVKVLCVLYVARTGDGNCVNPNGLARRTGLTMDEAYQAACELMEHGLIDHAPEGFLINRRGTVAYTVAKVVAVADGVLV